MATQDIQHLREEIQHTRSRLDATLTALERRLSAGQVLEHMARRVRGSDLGKTVSHNPAAAALVGTGLALLAGTGTQPGAGDRVQQPLSSTDAQNDPPVARPPQRTSAQDEAGQAVADESGRGRSARRPSDIPSRGWRDIALRIKDQLDRDNVSVVAAGVAFYTLLAIVPALAAVVSIYGLVADPADVQAQLESVSHLLPQEAQGIISEQVQRIAASSGGALGLGAVAGLLLTLWSASKGMKTLITALNIVYDEQEQRGFIKLNLIALGLTLGAVVFLVVALGLIVALPAVLDSLGLGETLRSLVAWLRWPPLLLGVIVALALIYRYGPSRDPARWRWVNWGAVAATVLWLAGSVAFSIYVRNFGSYNETYGSLGAVVILLMWFYLTAYVVLLGAEINAEMEHQTARDTTRGPAQPRGQRGAYVADTVGEQP